MSDFASQLRSISDKAAEKKQQEIQEALRQKEEVERIKQETKKKVEEYVKNYLLTQVFNTEKIKLKSTIAAKKGERSLVIFEYGYHSGDIRYGPIGYITSAECPEISFHKISNEEALRLIDVQKFMVKFNQETGLEIKVRNEKRNQDDYTRYVVVW